MFYDFHIEGIQHLKSSIYNIFVRLTTSFDHNSDGLIGGSKEDTTLNTEGIRESGTFLKSIALLPYLKKMGVNMPLPEGAFYAFAPLGQQNTKDVLEAGVIVVPGDAFGPGGLEYARFSYATSSDNIKEALRRIGPVLVK